MLLKRVIRHLSFSHTDESLHNECCLLAHPSVTLVTTRNGCLSVDISHCEKRQKNPSLIYHHLERHIPPLCASDRRVLCLVRTIKMTAAFNTKSFCILDSRARTQQKKLCSDGVRSSCLAQNVFYTQLPLALSIADARRALRQR